MDLRDVLNTDGTGERGATARGTTTTTSGNTTSAPSLPRQPSLPPSGPGPLAMPSPSINMNSVHGSTAHAPPGTPSASSVAPATPIQTGPPSQNAFRDYSHSTHASPVMQHREYTAPANPYQSPTSYQSSATPFANRPHVPPIQPPGHSHSLDARSPANASMPAPSPSYRQTPPASTINPGSQGYPFPPTSQPPPPASPSQRQYGSQASYGPRDSYSQQQSPVPPIGMPSRMSSHGSVASSSSFAQGQHQQQQQPPMPQTPPIATPGGSSVVGGPGGGVTYIQQQQHQRSHSMQSITTPTSAHNQQVPYGPPYVQGSPIATTRQALPQQHHLDHQAQRQSSQPPTPLGPPMSGPIRQSPAATYREPPSPYQQQRTSSSATNATTNPTYPLQSMQTSPPPPAPSTIQQQKQYRLNQEQQRQLDSQNEIQRDVLRRWEQNTANSSGHGAYDSSASAAAAELHRRSASQHSRSERERSISVSPKTRVPSLPSSTSGQDVSYQLHSRPQPPLQTQPHIQPQLPLASQPHSLPHLPPAPASVAMMDYTRDIAPVKRKLDDRQLSPEELQNHRRPPPPGTNGNHVPSPQMVSRPSDAPATPPRKRAKYSSLPPWAQTPHGRHLTASRNFSLKQHLQRMANGGKLVNGNAHHDAGTPGKVEQASRHASPETARSVHSAAATVKAEDHPVANHIHTAEQKDTKTFEGKFFPWEPSIENRRPMEGVSKAVGDFLFFNVLSNSNLEEMRSRNVQFEIEAKLGIIIDKSTNDRLFLPIQAGECVLSDAARIAFRSSMTEAQHHRFNQWLNVQVQESHRNPKGIPRLEVNYKHRRETDRFFELPTNQFAQRLPHCVSALVLKASPNLKARVTYDQQTGEVLAKIIKGRVADLHIHFPDMPLDCRISVNLEWDWEGPAEEIIQGHAANRERQPDRNKDRLSYTHGFYQIDLTQVTQGDGGAPGRAPEKEHELEVELDSSAVLEHGNFLVKQAPNRYTDLIDGFVDNIRLLARRCPPSNTNV